MWVFEAKYTDDKMIGGHSKTIYIDSSEYESKFDIYQKALDEALQIVKTSNGRYLLDSLKYVSS